MEEQSISFKSCPFRERKNTFKKWQLFFLGSVPTHLYMEKKRRILMIHFFLKYVTLKHCIYDDGDKY